jgi:hypothetical protein
LQKIVTALKDCLQKEAEEQETRKKKEKAEQCKCYIWVAAHRMLPCPSVVERRVNE